MPCLVVGAGGGEAREASLAENFQRLAMNPADECLAFGQLIEQGADPERIARRFGVTVRFVEGRLRLANLAACVFDALGAGEITLDVAKAYASTSDRERQKWVFGQLKGTYSGNHPESIRRMMTQATAGATDRRAKLVGEDAYVAAGGRIERDLFSDEVGERWLDLPLLEQLAAERMEALAAEAAAEHGLAWVQATLDSWVPYAATSGLVQIVPQREPLTADEAARIEAAETKIADLAAVFDDPEATEEALSKTEESIEAIQREITAIRDTPPIIQESLKATLGCFLLLGQDGVPALDHVFYIEPGAELAGGEEAAASEPGGDDSTGSTPSVPGVAAKPLSRALIDELAIQRRDVLAVHVAADPVLALDLAIFLMVDRDAVHSSERSGSSLLALAPRDPVFGFEAPDAKATVARTKTLDALDRSWMSGPSHADRFDAFRTLPPEARMAWLGHAVARTLEASANAPGERRCGFHDHLGQLLGIDVATWWRPTGANYLDRVPKAAILAALQEVGGPAFAAAYAGLKKAELAQSAERIFAGDFIGEVEVKERALAWVPEPMRFAAAAEAVPSDAMVELAPWEDEAASGEPGDATGAAPKSGGSDAEADASETSQVEEAA